MLYPSVPAAMLTSQSLCGRKQPKWKRNHSCGKSIPTAQHFSKNNYSAGSRSKLASCNQVPDFAFCFLPNLASAFFLQIRGSQPLLSVSVNLPLKSFVFLCPSSHALFWISSETRKDLEMLCIEIQLPWGSSYSTSVISRFPNLVYVTMLWLWSLLLQWFAALQKTVLGRSRGEKAFL